jgi:hypothetical protein
MTEGIPMSEPNDIAEPEVEAVEPKSFFARLGDVYMSPGEAFEEITRTPRLAFPIIVLIIISMVAGFYTAGILDPGSLVEQMQQAGTQGATPEQMQAILPTALKVILTVLSPIGSIIIILIVAGFFRVASIIATKENTYKDLFTVTVYATVAILIIQTIALILTYHLKGPATVSMVNMGSIIASSLGAILASLFGNDALPKFFMALSQRVEFFAIWKIVLLAIGYSTVTKKLKTATAATWLGIAYGVIALISAAASALRP